MTTLKKLMILSVMLAGGTSLALAQNGPATGGEPPVAGGAGGNPAVPGYIATPGYLTAPSPGFVTSEPNYRPIIHHRKMYMSAHGANRGTLRTGSAASTSAKHNSGY
ncbi:MAG TPA: hypothetical protein VEI98_10085 [Xanthobacteraceae bacterium]|nr:hypothetical protein [Xanthobacteraceae bacterium]